MKKLLIALIALLTLLAIVLTIAAGSILASRKKQAQPVPVETTVTETSVPETTLPPTTAPTEPEVTVSKVETLPPATLPAETAPSEPAEQEFDGVNFRPVSRTVYATQRVNVRSGPAVKYELIGKLEAGGSVEQIGIGDNGWSRIWFQGRKCFVASQYLSTENHFPNKPQTPGKDPDPQDLPPMREVKDTVYSTGSLNVRSGPGREYKAIGYLKNGQEAQRVAVADNGWSKIRYNSGFGYVSSSYLTKEKPSAPQEPAKAPTYKEVDQMVCATDNLNLRTGPGLNHKIAVKIRAGDRIRRTAIGDNGWSEVIYNGSRLYASSQYLTVRESAEPESQPAQPTQPSQPPREPAETNPRFREVDENMVASENLLLHSGPGAEFAGQGQISKGSLVHRTAVYDNGWSRILLNGKSTYVVSAYLAEEKKPEQSPVRPPKPSLPAEPNDGYTKNEATVYVTEDDVNVRTGPGTDFESLEKLKKGTALKRSAIGDDGWSRVLRHGKYAYIKSSLLTDDPPASAEAEQPPENRGNYREVEETVYAVDSVYVRKSPSRKAESLGSLNYGDSIRRTGVGDDGWSRVVFQGQTAYANSKYLSREKPEMPDFGETTTPGFPTPNSPFIYQYVDDPDQIPYAAFEPVSGNGSNPLPLIISLHGSAEVGQNREFMEGQHLTKVLREWEYTELDPFRAYVICPHINKDVPFQTWGTPAGADAIFKLIDYLKEVYDVDESRIILEGHSMGGQGALYIAADDRSCFTKLCIVSGMYTDADMKKITIPVKGCVGGGPYSEGPRDSPYIYKFMTTTFTDLFGKDNLYEGPYTHDDVAIKFFQKDEDGNKQADIIEWMLK